MDNKKTKEKYNEISEIDYLLKYLFLNEENYIIFNNGILIYSPFLASGGSLV